MYQEVNILWGWKIGSGFVLKASKIFPNIQFHLITRDKTKFYNSELSTLQNVHICDYNDHINKNLLCFYCISVDESSIISKNSTSNKNILRTLILKQNLKVAYDMLDYIKKISPSKLLVVTNPVEIISNFFSNKLGSEIVYGLGLELDAKRIREVCSSFFNIQMDEDIFMLWNHSLLPVPVLSHSLLCNELKKLTLFDILNNLKKKQNYQYSNTKVDFYKQFLDYIKINYLELWLYEPLWLEKIYEVIQFFSQLLVQSEFNNNKPPIDNPIDSMIDTFQKILFQNNYINISQFSEDWVYTGWIFKIWKNGDFIKLNIKCSEYENKLVYKSNMNLCSSFINMII